MVSYVLVLWLSFCLLADMLENTWQTAHARVCLTIKPKNENCNFKVSATESQGCWMLFSLCLTR